MQQLIDVRVLAFEVIKNENLLEVLAISVAQVWGLCQCCKCLRMWRNFFYRRKR